GRHVEVADGAFGGIADDVGLLDRAEVEAPDLLGFHAEAELAPARHARAPHFRRAADRPRQRRALRRHHAAGLKLLAQGPQLSGALDKLLQEGLTLALEEVHAVAGQLDLGALRQQVHTSRCGSVHAHGAESLREFISLRPTPAPSAPATS